VHRRYCKYYFELRELAEKDSKSFPLLPLTTADAQRLEVHEPTYTRYALLEGTVGCHG
jgi:hypothetical protein